MQDGVERPIAFNARKLKSSESQYASYKGELLALLFGINSYKFFLTRKPFLVRTDNNALSWLKSQKDAKGMLKRWLRILSTYEFEVIHRPGTKHANADALSRAPHAPSLREEEAKDLLEDDQILQLGENFFDDQQSEDSEEGLTEPVLEEGIQQPSSTSYQYSPPNLAEKQRADPLLSKVIEWVKTNHKPTGSEYKLLSSDEKHYADVLEHLQCDNNGVLRKLPSDLQDITGTSKPNLT